MSAEWREPLSLINLSLRTKHKRSEVLFGSSGGFVQASRVVIGCLVVFPKQVQNFSGAVVLS